MTAADKAQQVAANPNRSTWLTANAGSGKTRVLTERVARLLLLGAPPENILCLTYTKAAASEMQNRLFKTLGAWAMMDDEPLGFDLKRIGVLEEFDLDRARQLFAVAIETPGGLKIQTIHSFCAALLRRFPIEAGISADFVELEDSERQSLMREALRSVIDQDPFNDLGITITSENVDEFWTSCGNIQLYLTVNGMKNLPGMISVFRSGLTLKS